MIRFARLVAQGGLQGLTQANAHILHRVVGINMQIALGLHFQVDACMPGHKREHVVEKTHPCGYFRYA